MNIKYPDVQVQLSGEDGNAFAIIGRVQQALRRADVPEGEVKVFLDEATSAWSRGTSGRYDHLLQTCMRWVDAA